MININPNVAWEKMKTAVQNHGPPAVTILVGNQSVRGWLKYQYKNNQQIIDKKQKTRDTLDQRVLEVEEKDISIGIKDQLIDQHNKRFTKSMREIDPDIQNSEIASDIRVGNAIPSYANDVVVESVNLPATGHFLGVSNKYVPGRRKQKKTLFLTCRRIVKK